MHEKPAVLGMVGHAHRPLDRAATSEPGAVVVEQSVMICEGRLLEQRLGPRRAHPPVDEYDGLSRSSKLVLQLHTADGRPFHHLYVNLPIEAKTNHSIETGMN